MIPQAELPRLAREYNRITHLQSTGAPRYSASDKGAKFRLYDDFVQKVRKAYGPRAEQELLAYLDDQLFVFGNGRRGRRAALRNARVLTGAVADDGTIGRTVKGPDGKRHRVREHLSAAELAAPDWRRLRATGLAVEGTPTTQAVVAAVEDESGPIAPTRSESIIVTGNTFMIRRQIKALGGRWLGEQKAWIVPAEQLAALEELAKGNKIQLELSTLPPAPAADPEQGAPAPVHASLRHEPVRVPREPKAPRETPAQAFAKAMREPLDPVAKVTPQGVHWVHVAGPVPLVPALQMSADEFALPVGMYGWKAGEEVQIDAWPPPHDAPGGKRYKKETLISVMYAAHYTWPGRKVKTWLQEWNSKAAVPGNRSHFDYDLPELDGSFSTWRMGYTWKWHKEMSAINWDDQAQWTRENVLARWEVWAEKVQKNLARLQSINDKAFFNDEADPVYRLRLAQRYDAQFDSTHCQQYVIESALKLRFDNERSEAWRWVKVLTDKRVSPEEMGAVVTAKRAEQYGARAASDQKNADQDAERRRVARAFCAAIDANGEYLTIHGLRKLGQEVGFEIKDRRYVEERYHLDSDTLALPHCYGARTLEKLAILFQSMCRVMKNNSSMKDSDARTFAQVDAERQVTAREYSPTLGQVLKGWNEDVRQWLITNAIHLSDKELAGELRILGQVLTTDRNSAIPAEVRAGLEALIPVIKAEQAIRWGKAPGAAPGAAQANGRRAKANPTMPLPFDGPAPQRPAERANLAPQRPAAVAKVAVGEFMPEGEAPSHALPSILAHIRAGGSVYVVTHTGGTYIDRKTLERFEKAGQWLIKEDGSGYRIRSGKSSYWVSAGKYGNLTISRQANPFARRNRGA